MSKRRGQSYRKRVEEVNRIYDEHARSGVSNREIWRRFIYPVYAISERTFYNILNASARLDIEPAADTCQMLLFKFDDYEVNIIIRALVDLRNQLIIEGRYTDAVDELLLKLIP